MKKLLKVILCMAIILSNFSPLLVSKVKAAGNYTVAIAYADADVEYGSYNTYEEAKTIMNNYNSTDKAVAIIKNSSGKIINAKYAVAEIDYINYNKILTASDEIKYIYSTPNDAVSGSPNPANYLAPVASTWGADSAFLDYNDTYKAVQIKISGVTGWVALWDVGIIPISRYYGLNNTANYPNNQATIRASVDSVTLRTSPSTSASQIDSKASTTNATYKYYPSATTSADGYTWYKVQYDTNTVGYFADNGSWFTVVDTFKNDTYYYAYNNVLYHQIHMGTVSAESYTTLGDAPYYYDTNGKHYILSNSSGQRTNANVRYYSFDGNYFYSSYVDMVTDYRAGVYTHAANFSHPYYSYFMYLPSHAKTNYVAGTFNIMITAAGYSLFPTNPKTYVNPDTGTFYSGSSPAGQSMMYNIGSTLINVANNYGANALTLYSVAKVESGMGTSSIAYYKNNLYGMGAGDDNPFGNALSYNTIEESVLDYAKKIGQTAYASIYDYRYNGTHLGNKLSGQMVYYATDPYSGEAKAGSSYWVDAGSGNIDNNANTLGITKSTSSTTKIYSEPNSSSSVIYETKNYSNNKVLTNMPFIVTDKVNVIENGQAAVYYKVYTDVSLTSTRTLTSDTNIMYNFANCYGYIKESDLYVANSQPVITASNKNVTQYDSVNLLTGVTATDLETGDLTNQITVDDGDFDINTPGDYNITYTVKDKSNYSVSKIIKIIVEPSGRPTIVGVDTTTPQYKTFNPLTGITVEDINETGLIDDVQVTGTVDVTKTGEYNLVYSVTDATGLTDTFNRKVTVIANEIPVISATNLTVYKGQTFNYLNGITAIDKEDGEVNSSLTYSGTVDMNTEGTYKVTYSAKDLDNQVSTKTVTITVETKVYTNKNGMFYLNNLTYNDVTKKVDFTGYLVIKGINNTTSTDISYDIIFENQYNGNTIVKSLSRLTSDVPFVVPNETGYNYSGSWFRQALDLTDLPSGDYTVYVRARSGDYESKVLLKNEYFNTKVARKFSIDAEGYQFRINYYNRSLPLELFVRENGLLATVNNPTIDNMYNQVYSAVLDGTTLRLTASSHNVQGNYVSSANVERYVMLENIATFNIAKTVNVGAITNGPYVVNLKVSDGYNKSKVWYNTNIDLSDLPKGTYSILVRTKTGSIDDYGELYDALYISTINQSQTIGDKKITIKRNDSLRFRLEITIE